VFRDPPSLELVLAGAGDDDPVVRRAAAAQPSVRVLGWRDDVAPLLARANLFVLPTVAETNALAMLEGMASGLPGIVSATAGLRARGPEGVLLAENHLAAWIEALHEVDALGPAGRRDAGRRARAWAEAHADSVRSHARWAMLLS
jgi:glycosyltransferase involved in cell wall biosynthesis